MKALSRTLLLLAGMSLLLAGCQKEGRFGSDKDLIRFTAAADAQTKAAYSGVLDNANFERIDWEEGDNIRIWSPQAVDRYHANKHYADYKVFEVLSPDGHDSRARIVNADIQFNAAGHQIGVPNPGAPENDNVNGLIWGNEPSYDFYASYPVTADGTMGKVTGTIATPQTLQEHAYTNPAKTVWEPGNVPAYMTAAATGIAPNSTVELRFFPAFTAFEFKVVAGEDDAVALTSFTIETLTQNAVIAGGFTMDCATRVATPATGGSSSVTVDLTGHTVTANSPFTFTVFALPVDFTNLKITLVGDKIGTRTLLLNDKDGVPVPFPACKKYRSTLRLPSLLWARGEDLIWDLEAVGQDIIWDN